MTRVSLGGGAHAVEVVFAEEYDGEFPDGGEVHGLVELALVDGAVAEEAEHYLIVAAVLDGEGDAGGDAQLTADDGVAAHEVELRAEQMHGPALALAAAGGLAHQFGHHFVAAHASGQGLAMVAVVGDDVIIVAQGVDGADGDGFLAVIDMEKAFDVASRVLAFRLSLELTDELHLPVETEQIVFGQIGHIRCFQHVNSSQAVMNGWLGSDAETLEGGNGT